MENVVTLFWQIIVMFILALVGYIMFKTKKITSEGSKTLGNILIYLSLPCVIINSFLVDRTLERLIGLGVSALAALVVLFVSMGISRLILGRNAIENFAGSFSNPGFFGIPLITAMLADGAVFYVAAFIAFLNLLQWTYGVSLLKKSDENGMIPKREKKAEREKKPFWKAVGGMALRLIKAPFMIAILIGLFFFLTPFSMPAILGKCITFVGNLNTPIAMFTIGIYLADTKFLKMFTKGRLYLVSAVRMGVVPLVAMALLCLVPNSMWDLKMAVLIAAACPVGSNVAVYAQLHGKDYTYAVETVVISTIFSVVTLPGIVALAQYVWNLVSLY